MDDFEASVRRAFTRLTREDLPRAALARGWPIRTPEAFERLLLQHLQDSAGDCGEGGPCLFDLVMAVELGERMLAGNLCCTTMSRRLGCTDPGGKDPRRAEAWRALMAVLDEAGRSKLEG